MVNEFESAAGEAAADANQDSAPAVALTGGGLELSLTFGTPQAQAIAAG
ncbi:hypothetical protein [Allosphingosinicella deserti]|nr:hypothetical protein [Sphingomonas deserti]